MARQKLISSERKALEARIGNVDLIARPAELLKGQWDAQVQADVIISKVRCALRPADQILVSEGEARVKLDKSYLGYQLREPSKQSALAQAARVLAEEAGINPETVHIHKDHGGRLSKIFHPLIKFGPAIYVVLEDETAARQLISHVQPPGLAPAITN